MNKIKSIFIVLLSALILPLMAMDRNIHQTESNIEIDGIANEIDWQKAKWQALDQHILGEQPTKEDFSGRF